MLIFIYKVTIYYYYVSMVTFNLYCLKATNICNCLEIAGNTTLTDLLWH
jgi:hypothetical protein